MKKLIFPLVLATLLLSACGNDAVSETPAETDESISETVKEASNTEIEVAKDTIEKTEADVKEAVSDDNEETTAEVSTAVLVDDTDEEVILTASDTVKVTDGNNIPTLSGKYVGDGNGPGAYWRSDFDYTAAIEEFVHLDDVVIKTAPNGVKLKVVPHYCEGEEVYVPITDGQGKDLEPGSPYMEAVNYFFYNADNAYYWATDFSAIDATLPTTSTKKTGFDVNDASLLAYKKAYDYKRDTMDGGTPYERAPGVINDSLAIFSDGIGEYADRGGTIWEFDHLNGYWRLTINQNLAAYQWDGVKQVLHYIDPSGDALYNVIYTDCYTGSEVIQEWDTWYPVGNAQIYQPDNTNMGYVMYYFK